MVQPLHERLVRLLSASFYVEGAALIAHNSALGRQ